MILILIIDTWWGFVLFIFLLLLIFWNYRRYEIDKINRQNHFNNQVFQVNHISENILQPEIETKIDQCLTGLHEKRLCFFNTNGNMIRIDDGANECHELATVDLLLNKINGDKFCNHLCQEKKNNNILSESESQSYQHQIKPFIQSIELRHPVNSFNFFTYNPAILPGDTPVSPHDEEFIINAVKIIEAKYRDYRFSAGLLAQDLNMSISQVNRKLNALTGVAAGQFIRSFRLQRASECLIQKSDTISDICFSTGYNEMAYFSRAFKKEFGCSPSVYRKLMTKKSISTRRLDN